MSENETALAVTSSLTGQVANVCINVVVRGGVAGSVGLEDVPVEGRRGQEDTDSLVCLTHEDTVNLFSEESGIDQGVVPWAARVERDGAAYVRTIKAQYKERVKILNHETHGRQE